MQRPTYEALDGRGIPFERPARVVGELPHAAVDAALSSATEEVSKLLGIEAQRRIPYGAPVFVAFGLSKRELKTQANVELLMTKGDCLSLDFCPAYKRPNKTVMVKATDR